MDLFGWDTVFVGGIDSINEALARAGNALIPNFTFTEDGVSASGSFGGWSIVPGGSGQLLRLCFPIASGQLTPAPGMSAVDLAGINVVLQVSLRWLDRQEAKDTRELAFDLREVAREGSQDPTKISVVSVSPTNRLTPNQVRTTGHAIACYISAHAAQVSFVLAKVGPTALGSPRWMDPVASAYTVVSAADGSVPALAIMTVVAARDTSSLPRNVDAGLVPDARDDAPRNWATFAIAGPLVLRHVIGPAIASSFGMNENAIGLGPDGGIALVAVPINLPPLPGSGKTPTLSKVTATLKDTRVSIEYAGGMDLAPGIRMTFNINCELEGIVGRDDLGNDEWGPARMIFWIVSRNQRHDVQEEWWFTASRKLAGGEFSWLTDQFFDRAINHIADAVVNVIDRGLTQGAPSAVNLAPVLWSGQSKFSPASGQLASGLVLRGVLA
jgi:hypothetical protein